MLRPFHLGTSFLVPLKGRAGVLALDAGCEQRENIALWLGCAFGVRRSRAGTHEGTGTARARERPEGTTLQEAKMSEAGYAADPF